MHAEMERIIERPDDLTASWLTGAIGAGTVTGFTVERIGTGQMSECYRIGLTYADTGRTSSPGPGSVVLKVAASDPTSRQTGLALGLYEREVRFYRDIAPRLGGPIAPCYHAGIDTTTGAFDLLLGDAGPAAVGDELAGATVEQAHLGVAELARLQGPLLADSALSEVPWLNREAPISQSMLAALYAGFTDRYGAQIAPAHRMVCERLVAAFDGYHAVDDQAQGLMHGDYRLDNLLFGAAGADRALTVVDWQTVSWGPAMTDLSYFLGTALPAPQRREHYGALLRTYHEALGPGAPLALADVAGGVRRQSFFGVMMAIVSSMLVERTDRGDRLFMTMLARHCDHVLDTGALADLPDAGPDDALPEPLRPSDDDEDAHTPTGEPRWNESWYADFADAAQGVGGWFRIGLLAHQRTAWIHALLCGPDMPTVAVDAAVPLPADPWVVRTDAIEIAHGAPEPLCTYRVDVHAKAQSYADPAALLRGEPGTPVEMTMNLVWTTDGTPYTYRVTTRYEIPCTVSGTVTVGDTRYALDTVPGQRDHSWGERDWWSIDWIWSALHLDDGTHLHGVNIRIPGAPTFSIGYAQNAQAPEPRVIELDAVESQEAFAINGLPLDATVIYRPLDITADVRVRGHAPVRLTADDGRVSQFPRVWATVETADGRRGVGWLEWNRNPRGSEGPPANQSG